jgi:phospholipid/cholesterol/gamma-HCH transport system substrate-binding protein
VRNTSAIGRAAAMGAVAIAVVAVVIILLSGGSSYTVHAIFQNASQLVTGDQVEVGGNPIGTVNKIELTPDGQAKLTLGIADGNYNPLRQGTVAVVRESSLSGIANRYVDLRLGPGGSPSIPNNGTIGSANTTSEVDLDQLFNTLDQQTRTGLQQVIDGFATAYTARGAQAQKAWQYLNPALAATSLLFREINRDTNKFTGFIVQTGNLVSDIAQRQTDLSALVQHLNTTTTALANQNVALGQAIQRLPNFMRVANTTFVNLRGALDDLKPLVDDSKPVAPKLARLLEQLKPLAENSVPTVRDLSNIISRPGNNTNLIQLVKLGVPLAAATVQNVRVNGKTRPGAFPQSVNALNSSTPELAGFRPYAVDLTGWFEGYSHPGLQEANGAFNRAGLVLSAFSVANGQALNIAPALQLLNALNVLTFNQGARCPGSMERGGLFYPESGFPCNPSEVPTGP